MCAYYAIIISIIIMKYYKFLDHSIHIQFRLMYNVQLSRCSTKITVI